MSRVAEAYPIASRLLEREPYVLSNASDPETPVVGDDLRVVLANRVRALDEFFSTTARVPQDLFQRLAADACARTLRRMGLHIQAGEGVESYLACHPDIIDAVVPLAAEAQARARVGDAWSLELHSDRETNTVYLTLQLRRQTYDADTLQVVDAVGAVAETLLAGTSAWILVTTDFQPPSRA